MNRSHTSDKGRGGQPWAMSNREFENPKISTAAPHLG
jgi:hypothetical protein